MSKAQTQGNGNAKKVEMVIAAVGIGGVLVLVLTILGILDILNVLGLSIFGSIKLSNEMKVYIPLYAIMAVLTVAFSAGAVYLARKGFTRYGGSAAILSAVFGLSATLIPYLYKLNVSQLYLFGTVIGACSAGAGGVILATIPQTAKAEILVLSAFDTSIIAIFSAATAVVTGIVGGIFPSPTGGYTHLGDAVTFIVALIFGSKIGMLTGIIGSVVADFYLAYPRWFVTIVAHGIEGFVAGLGKGRSILIQAVLCAIGGVLMAFTYFYVNIFIKGYLLAVVSLYSDVLGQVGVSLVISMILIKPLERATKRILRR